MCLDFQSNIPGNSLIPDIFSWKFFFCANVTYDTFGAKVYENFEIYK